MRNIFDQYTQPENRLTHALVCTLHADRSLLRPFLRWAGCKDTPNPEHLHITEQQTPGVPVSGDEDEGKGKGIPDGCVYSDDGWALLIESKVSSSVSIDQLRRHIATARRSGFEEPYLLLLSVDDPPKILPPNTTHHSWREVYAWFRRHTDSSPSRTFTEYMEVFESRMIADEYSIRGTITMFDGLRFDTENPYTYREGKRLIRLLGDKLQERKDLDQLGVDPNGLRRGAITGRAGSGVWDFIPLRAARNAKNFTDYPHLTMAIREENAGAAVTIPNGVRSGFRTKLKGLGESGFLTLLAEIEHRLQPMLKKSIGSKSHVYALQRHYPSQRSGGIKDARLDADLRTIIPGNTSGVRYQPQWAEAIYHVMINKKSNIQLGIEVTFSYECPIIRSSKAENLFAQSFLAMKPMIDFVLD
ncbi:MAG: hypothetical protein KC996_04220 [Phycisphaerales bacterium]|nr:hypothetical protein [Phycisphaerales bacterium]